MEKMKCFDIVGELIEEKSEEFEPLHIINRKWVKVLENYCEAIDILYEEFEGEMVETEVDDIKMTVRVSIECHRYISSHKYVEALKERSVEFCVEMTEEGLYRLNFVFPPVWNHWKIAWERVVREFITGVFED